METKLTLITEKARKEPTFRFTNLVHLLNVDNLRECFYLLKKDCACGIDGVLFEDYEKQLESKLLHLVDQMKKQAYKPQAVRRTHIPKANGKLRPLGIPTIEDKMVQLCITRILSAIYEVDFLDVSFGFRPQRSCHDALSCLDETIIRHPVKHIIDADIKGCFDNVDHTWLMKCLEQRIGDKNLLRLIKRFLISGYVEAGNYHDTEKGTPQGGVISPILANIYLHYILDLWLERWIKKQCDGFVSLIRYADDFVICLQKQEEALGVLKALKERFAQFGLELAEEKTHILGFGRYAAENAQRKGCKAETFTFLGFTHYCDQSRKGNFKVGRRTDRKKFQSKMKEMNTWLRLVRCTA